MAEQVMTMTVSGSFVTMMLRQAAEHGDVLGVLTMVESMEVSDLAAVISGTYDIVGDSVSGFDLRPTGRSASDPKHVLERAREREVREAKDHDRTMLAEAIADWVETTGGHPRDLADGIREWAWHELLEAAIGREEREEADNG